MSDWRRWVWPGIVATVLLTVLAVWFRTDPIETDLSERIGSAQQEDWASVSLDARDVTISGIAPTEEMQAAAEKKARDTYGVRVVDNKATLAPLADPYEISVRRTDEGIALSGHYPLNSVQDSLAQEAAAAFPGISIDNSMTLARGAPDAHVDQARFAMTQLAGLNEGEVTISNQKLSVSGKAADFDTYEKVTSALAGTLPDGMELGTVSIDPPTVDGDYIWSAERMPDGKLVLDGYAPSPEIRTSIADSVSQAMPDMAIDNRLRIGGGAPEGFAGFTAPALAALSRLKTGKAELRNSSLMITGEAPDADAGTSARSLLEQLPQGLELAGADIEIPEPEWNWTARTDGVGMTLDGTVPDRKTGDTLVERAARMVGSSNVADNQTVGEGAPQGFIDVAIASLRSLSRMESGEASITESDVKLNGTTLVPGNMEALRERFTSAIPSGFKTVADFSAPASTGERLGAAECQKRLDMVLGVNRIYFDTGSATLDADSLGVVDRLASITRRCEAGGIEAAGYTDSDGDDAANLALSQARAETVVNALVGAGTPAGVVKPVGYGEADPVAPNDTAENKARNRRIEFRVQN